MNGRVQEPAPRAALHFKSLFRPGAHVHIFFSVVVNHPGGFTEPGSAFQMRCSSLTQNNTIVVLAQAHSSEITMMLSSKLRSVHHRLSWTNGKNLCDREIMCGRFMLQSQFHQCRSDIEENLIRNPAENTANRWKRRLNSLCGGEDLSGICLVYLVQVFGRMHSFLRYP